MFNILSKDKINTKRQFEFDVAKYFATLFMVIVHTFDHMTTTYGYVIPRIIEFLGCTPSACVFMFAMGLGMVYTRHNSAKEFLKRGIHLIILGYLLNFFRETLLLIIGNIFNVSNSYQDVSIFSSLMNVDILQFAGLSFILVALFKKLKVKPYMILLIAIILNSINCVCLGLFSNASEYIQYPMGLFVFTNSETSFSLFAWFIYPAMGMYFGSLLKHIKNKDKFYKIIFITGIILLFSTIVGIKTLNMSISDLFMTDLYFIQPPTEVIWCISIMCILIPIYYVISNKIKGKFVKIVKYLSDNVNKIYIIQWLVITYTIALMELLNISLFKSVLAIPIGIIIFILCSYISKIFDNVSRLKK